MRFFLPSIRLVLPALLLLGWAFAFALPSSCNHWDVSYIRQVVAHVDQFALLGCIGAGVAAWALSVELGARYARNTSPLDVLDVKNLDGLSADRARYRSALEDVQRKRQSQEPEPKALDDSRNER